MAGTARGLGKGLDALLGEEVLPGQGIDGRFLPLEQVESSISQPRKNFDEESLAELANSIREHGILQPITVRPLASGYYQIVAGERRWRAARIAGLDKIPVIILEADDKKMMELALVENLQRENLNSIEEAEGYYVLLHQYHMTQEQIADVVGKSRSAVANALRLLGLEEGVRAMVQDGRLSGGHGRALLALPQAMQQEAADRILRDELSVRQTEQIVRKLLAPEREPEQKKDPDAVDYAGAAAERLTEKLGRVCRIVGGRKKGKLELEYYGIDDLNDLLERLEQILGKNK